MGVAGELEDENWRLCSKTLVRGVPGELEDENWGLGSTTLVRGVSGELEDENWRLVVTSVPKECPARVSHDPMSWKRCGTWKVCARNGRETSAQQHTEANLCRGSSVETVRDEPRTSSLKRRDPRLPQKESS